MTGFSRRDFLGRGLVATAGGWSLRAPSFARGADRPDGSELHIAGFRFDVTPPLGHSCCGGWIKPVQAVDDPLEAVGLVLIGAGKPIVLCAVDWTGISNEAHLRWREALAEAAGTTADRVAVQCLHQHNAPFACLDAERIVQAQGDLPHIVDLDFFRRCLDRGQQAIRTAVPRAQLVTRIAHGQAKVDKVAGNRRVSRDEQGRVVAMRGSSCRNPELRALPEGLIDPWLKTVAFFAGDRKLAACHYYATHPMSYYGDGRVSSDFVGLARKQFQKKDPDCLRLYFTGCAGNVAAGKYNDGSPAMRPILTQRILDAMIRSEESLRPCEIESVGWRTVELLPPPNKSFSAESLLATIEDRQGAVSNRNRPAYTLAYLQRYERQQPIVLSCLAVNDPRLLHLPGECFVQYQLRAQETAPERFVATAAYGDGGPWYVPVAEEYSRGGYEVSVAFCGAEIDELLSAGIKTLVA